MLDDQMVCIYIYIHYICESFLNLVVTQIIQTRPLKHIETQQLRDTPLNELGFAGECWGHFCLTMIPLGRSKYDIDRLVAR